MKKIWGALFLLCLIGCFGLRDQEERLQRMNDPERALLFGHIEMPPPLFRSNKRLRIIEVKPNGEKVYWETSIDKTGSFLFEDVPLHVFSMDCIIETQGDTTVKSCFEKEKLNKTTIRLGESGAYYWGAWRYLDDKVPVGKRGIFSLPVFDLTLVPEPTAKQALEMLIPRLKKTRWYEEVLPYLNNP